jgi:hypothetical protein
VHPLAPFVALSANVDELEIGVHEQQRKRNNKPEREMASSHGYSCTTYLVHPLASFVALSADVDELESDVLDGDDALNNPAGAVTSV